MVVGFILASILKRRRKTEPFLPIIQGQFEASHAIPGRIRFRVPLIENKENTQIENIRNELTRIPDIQSVEICSNSGSILVQYDGESIEPYVVCGILIKVLGLEDTLGTHPESIVQREIRMVANAINQTFYNSTAGTLDLTSAIMILIILFGLYKILFQKDRSLPGGITLLWWAYVMAKGRNQ
jgi:hypothetical protein